ncbi:hypothetical protein EKO27_g8844 [Xylaria grammica]|uniref:Uncharacterized protein n=1 Tax=Xylaria grammica TaxID=363999 RepID=A0A439CVS1_9PEZI|nr:hypothetical protein EKO27_g8844 [Xylaria grammica]
MVRQMTPSPIPSHEEAGRRFQLPARNKKRTQASTMFHTTAKNLSSNVPFRWTSEQVIIFEDWIRFQGSNATTADLTPLLQVLDLDGYEDIKNSRGECVHDLIIAKVRRKLARTKGTTKTQVKGGSEKQVEKGEGRFVNNVKLPYYPTSTPYDVREHTYEYGTKGAVPDLNSPSQLITPHVSPNPNRQLLNSHRQEALRFGTATKGTSRSKSVSDSEFSDTLVPSSCSSSATGYNKRIGKSNNLGVCMEKLKEAVASLSLEIDRLPRDAESCALETAAYDVGLELEHLDNLVKDYISC